MKKLLLLLPFIFLLSSNCLAQPNLNAAHLQTINNYIEGYNSQEFDKMRNSLSGVLKAFLTKKKIAELYTFQHQMLGVATIANVTSKSEGSYTVDLKYERDTTETLRLGLSISKKNKIIGMRSYNPKPEFKKTTSPSLLTEEMMIFKIDSLVHVKNQAGGFSGSVLVMKDKKEFYKKSVGYKDFETKSSLNDSSLFDLASCSKQFTAMGIMLLQEQGKLSYTSKVEDFIPGFPYKDITIENLLTHTSGLPDYMELFQKHWDKTKIATNQDVVEYLKKYKPKASFKPGKTYEYSNTGYVLLATIIENISGKSFAEFLNENIFQPLGMKHSRVYNTKYSNHEKVENYAKGHTYISDSKSFVAAASLPELDYYIYLDGITGDGAVNSTITDMGIWVNSLRDYKLLKKESFDKAIKPFQTSSELSNYGYGWELQNAENFENLISHSGNWGGDMTYVLHFLDKELSVVILSNNEYINIQNFSISIAKIMTK